MDSAIVTMAHYGEGFKILDHRKWWFKVRMAYDQTEGWVENLQVLEISEDQ